MVPGLAAWKRAKQGEILRTFGRILDKLVSHLLTFCKVVAGSAGV